jgi:soluble lytic murein transglycosylase-like protein
MRNLRRTYVHRGDVERRRRRLKRALLLTGFVTALIAAVENRRPVEASAEQLFSFSRDSAPLAFVPPAVDAAARAMPGGDLARWNRVFNLAQRYSVSAELAGDILDAALAEGIEPELAFRLVRVESEFNPHATSSAGAIGLTQLMLPTARYFDSTVTRQQLYDRSINLHIGFRYLRSLIREYGDVQTALLVYNRGPQAVESSRDLGLDPSNGYERMVMRGYRGKGVVN